ncbi:MAG: NADH-quinone oxidoreductase subunit NuoB [Spirochaetales bacterium]|nr:NADH-quinone oxidoreductase subunit NuoB [Spirochaetales bacterium]
MIKALRARFFQKHRTIKFPKTIPPLPERYLGVPKIDRSKCVSGCTACMEICPVDAISQNKKSGIKNSDAKNTGLLIDLGKCIFCGKCAEACEHDSLVFTKDFRMAATDRKGLIICESEELKRAEKLRAEILRIFKRSLKLRQVSAGGCNACEADINVLGTIGWDLDRFGIKFVASPRHADGLVVTGPVTNNMREALLKTYEAIPSPKIVIAVGSCAVSGGLFSDHDETGSGVDTIIPVDLFIPGCPPNPLTILDGLLRILGRIH